MRGRPLGSIPLLIVAIGFTFTSPLGKDAFRAKTEGIRAPAKSSTPSVSVVSTSVKAQSLWPDSGERWLFRFERKVSAEYQGKVWLKLALGGRASVEPAGEFGGHRFYLLSYEVDRMQMQGEGPLVEKNEKRQFPLVRIEVDPTGNVREMRWTSLGAGISEPKEEDADLVKDLTAQWLFFENRSRLGVATAKYTTAVHSKTNLTVLKNITRYETRPEISDLESVHEWATDTQRVQRIEGTENFSLKSSQGSFDQKTSYRWVFLSSEKAGLLASNLNLGGSFLVSDMGGAPEAAKIARLDRKSFVNTWKTIGTLVPHERLRYFGKVKAALDAGQSELIPLIVQSLTGKNSLNIEWRTGVGALAASSNPEAAKALIDLYRGESLTHDDKLSVLAAVTAGEGAPAPEWKDVLAENTTAVDTSLRDASLFALGSAIRKEVEPGRRKELETLLWKEVKDSNSESDQLAILDAIGNSGSSEYYGYVKDRFASSSPAVRAKAVAAVRFLTSDLAQPIIDSARADPVATVRKAAEWSGKFRD